MKALLCGATALVAFGRLLEPSFAADSRPLVTTQPDPQADVAPYFVAESDPRWSDADWSAEDIAALRKKIKYVFVLFNENRSFDHEYGTLPGVDGLYSDGKAPRAAADTPGFTETYRDTVAGQTVTVQPFLVGPAQNASFKDSTDHSHEGLAAKIDVRDGVARMDRFAEVEWRKYAAYGEKGERMGTQMARLVMAHMDCDTIPFFWRYATRFTIFDNNFATEDTPSTPNAIAILAGQAGETQWVKHPSATNNPADTGITGADQRHDQRQDLQRHRDELRGRRWSAIRSRGGARLSTEPASGASRRLPHENWDPKNTASNITVASLPLTMMGGWINLLTHWDRSPAFDLPDVQKDISAIAALGRTPVQWRWYQNGYDLEPTDSGAVVSHKAYVSHHNGAQYFGYIANNPAEQMNLRGEGDFFADLASGELPAEGGVFYVRGGYYNLNYPKQTAVIQNANYPNPKGLTPDELAKIAKVKSGDDDHPGYSDSQLTEAMAARVINAIAGNPRLWDESAIVITYDESDGLYDHVPPRILSYGPDGLPLARGVRIPLILISPYARAHAVSHAEGDHNAIIETINALFGLPALSSLPDEKQALADGNSADLQRLRAKGLRAEVSRASRHALGHNRQPHLRLRQGARPWRPSPAPGLAGAHSERRHRELSPLRRQGLRRDRRHAGERSPEHPERDPGGVQHLADNAAGLQLMSRGFTLGVRAASIAMGGLLAVSAHAGPIVDRIKAEGMIRCGGVSRPGLVSQSPDGRQASGLFLDLCRAVGAALLGPEGRIEFRPYDFDAAFAPLRDGGDDLAFLDGAEILDQRLAGKTILGPPVAFVSTGVMVPENSSAKSLADLSGKSVCFYQGSSAHRSLEAWMAGRRLDFTRMAYTEYGEMDDAYAARKCDAVAGEIGDLAVGLDSGEGKGVRSRTLPEPLATWPVFAVTPANDAQWAAVVAWAIVALERAELASDPWTASGGDAAAANGADLELAEDWRKRVLAAAGSYAEIYARNLGERSRLRLPRGPNAPVEAGGQFVTPFRE